MPKISVEDKVKEDCDWNFLNCCLRNRTGIKNVNPFGKECKGVCNNWEEGPIPPERQTV